MEIIHRSWYSISKKPFVIDVLIAIFLSGLALLFLLYNWQFQQPIDMVWAVIFTLFIILPIALRRRFPLIILLLMTILLAIYRYIDIPEGTVTAYTLMLALFSAGAYGSRRWRNWTRGISMSIVALSLTYMVLIDIPGSTSIEGSVILVQLVLVFLNLFLFGASWWVGDIFRNRRERELQLNEKTVQLEIEREENAQRAIVEERVRIARELHDVVAHHVSVMGVQAGAARKVMDKQPRKAQEALSTIESSSRQAVSEMQRIIGFLREDGKAGDTTPQPDLGQLTKLVADMKRAGLHVEMTTEGNERSISPSVSLSAFRIIQEALTNVLKHADSAKAKVRIQYINRFLEIEITDNGKGKLINEDIELKGKGLIGIRERVKLHGGEFKAGPLPDIGFQVRAKLPLK